MQANLTLMLFIYFAVKSLHKESVGTYEYPDSISYLHEETLSWNCRIWLKGFSFFVVRKMSVEAKASGHQKDHWQGEMALVSRSL